MEGIVHTPVMPEEVLHWIAPREGRWYIDCTLGEGGHTELLLSRFPDIRVIGIDQDPEVGRKACGRLERFNDRFRFFNGNFCRIGEAAALAEGGPIGGVLMDLGISSFHFDASGRGFSFQRPEPLDMRLSPDRRETAADILNGYSEGDLARLFREFGEEPFAGRIARAVVRTRKEGGLGTTTQFAALVEGAVPAAKRSRRIHPATRVFQALRIAVNRELEVLPDALEGALGVLEPEGRLVVIAFHSLEDRIVKRFFRENTPHCRCPERAPVCTCGRPGRVEILTRKPVMAGEEEVEGNPRSRSARLRAARMLPIREEKGDGE